MIDGRIARVWKGYGTAESVKRYCEQHFAYAVLPQLRGLDGFIGSTVLVRGNNGQTEVVVITLWQSIEAVKQFAGDEYERAVVEPAVRDLLDRFDERVAHYTIVPNPD